MYVLTTASVAEKAAHIAQVDPHGWIISLVSIALVFMVLLLLCIVYSLSGYYFTHRHYLHKQFHKSQMESRTSDEEAAAIALALKMYKEEQNVHDKESGRITIKRK